MPDVSLTYSVGDAVKVCGLTRRKLEFLEKQGVSAAARELRRPGSKRQFLGFPQLVALSVIGQFGFKPSSPQAREVSRQLNDLEGPRFLYLEGSRCWRSDSSIADVLVDAPVVRVCDVPAAQLRMCRRLGEAQLPFPAAVCPKAAGARPTILARLARLFRRRDSA